MKTAKYIAILCSINTLVLAENTEKKAISNVKSKPNVLFICIDDLRPELRCYGNKYIHSPNIDKLAQAGALFQNHFVQVPTSGASRGSMLTGMLPTNASQLSNEVIRNFISSQPETEQPESFIHQLKRNGYHTVGIGKISHSADGFLYDYTGEISSVRELPYSWNEVVFDYGKWGTGWNAFFGYADGSSRQSKNNQVKPYEMADVEDTGYPDGLTAQLAVNQLSELAQRNEPFFLGVGFFKPHLPFNAPKKYWDLYDREDIPLSECPFIPENVHLISLHDSPEIKSYELTDEKPSLKAKVSDEYARTLRHAYFASVELNSLREEPLLSTDFQCFIYIFLYLFV
ncbi:MAG: sulfatase-like hydrolase/transferase [Paludibacter sp.]|nr:sulfatase-like hydrolase/transferase [Paludibacter sp.]